MSKQIRARWSSMFVVLLLAVGVSAAAEDYTSFSGKFRINLPEGWKRLDYQTVDYYLFQGQADPQALQYEAVFSPREGGSFADDEYLILTIDTMGTLSTSQKDSVLENLGEVFGEGVKYYPIGDLMTSLSTGEPMFDAARQTAAVISNITEPGQPDRKNLLVLKFYDRGIANFYFYSLDSTFTEHNVLFANVIESFSTKNLDASLSSEDVKVADLESRKLNRGSNTVIYVGILAILVILAVIIVAWRIFFKRR